MFKIFALLQAAPAAPISGFWQQNGDKIVVSVITAVLVLVFSEPIKALFKELGGWIETARDFVRPLRLRRSRGM
jgi:hypothetical protein